MFCVFHLFIYFFLLIKNVIMTFNIFFFSFLFFFYFFLFFVQHLVQTSHATSLSCFRSPSRVLHRTVFIFFFFNTGVLTFRLFVCAGVAHFAAQALNIHGNICSLGLSSRMRRGDLFFITLCHFYRCCTEWLKTNNHTS